MSKAAKSLYYFGWYGVVVGIVLLCSASVLAPYVGLPQVPVGWGCIVGFLTLIVGVYDVLCGRYNVVIFIKASIVIRYCFLGFTILLYVLGIMPAIIILFGVIDGVGAAHTHYAIMRP